jgi:hypothetical protein
MCSTLNRARDAFDMQLRSARTDAEVFRMLANKRLSDANLVRYVRETLHEGAGNDNAIKVRNVVYHRSGLANEGRGATPGTTMGRL